MGLHGRKAGIGVLEWCSSFERVRPCESLGCCYLLVAFLLSISFPSLLSRDFSLLFSHICLFVAFSVCAFLSLVCNHVQLRTTQEQTALEAVILRRTCHASWLREP